MPLRPTFKIADGTEQGERLPAALQAGYFQVDERSMEELLAISASLSARLRYFNLAFREDGDWSDFFHCDETAVMSQIVATDVKRLETNFLRLLQSAPERELADHLIRLPGLLDLWLQRLEAIETAAAQALHRHLSAAIESRLAAELHSLGSWMQGRETEATTGGRPFESFARVWDITISRGRPLFRKARLPALGSEQEVRNWLRGTFYLFLNAIYYLKKLAPDYLQESMRNGSHSPAMSLFIAFLKLYGEAQGRLNELTGRHTHFYYRDFLKLAPRREKADSVYLSFGCDTACSEVRIPVGTGFPAGKDGNGDEILYRSDAELQVTDARLRDVRTLFLERDPLVSPERELSFVTRVRAARLPDEEWCLPEPGAQPWWPVFGAAEGEVPGKGGARDAELGFVLASAALLLREGARSVEISVLTDQPKQSETSALLEEVTAQGISAGRFCSRFGILFRHYLLSGEELLTGEEKEGIVAAAWRVLPEFSARIVEQLLSREREDLYASLLSNIFTLRLTGEGGWHRVTDPVVLRPDAREERRRSGLRFAFSLGPEAPPIVACRPDLHGAGFEPGLPLASFIVNSRANFFPYSLFADLGVREIVVEVSVRGVTSVLAYNNHGQLDPSKPFTPFGPLPSCNSYFVFGNDEISRKALTSLTVHLEWGELPAGPGGFEEHYAAYPGSYPVGAFQADLSVLRHGAWHPDRHEPRARVPLFAQAPSGGVDGRRELKVKVLKYHQPVPTPRKEEAFRYEQSSRNGFFRLSLGSPEQAFGHRLYPSLLTTTLAGNAKAKSSRQLPLPNPPYTPLLNRIAIDYRARSVLKAGQEGGAARDEEAEKLYHLHPFGAEKVYPAVHSGRLQLLPQYRPGGNLLLGFSAGRAGGLLTLLFHLKDDSTIQSADTRPQVEWHYLARDQWHRLPDMRVLSDSTDGFLTTGIVTLDLPDSIGCDNTVMPTGLYWVRASTPLQRDAFCSMYSVRLHALKATRVSGSPGHTLPAGAITAPLAAIAGVGSISQPAPSFGGSPPETADQLTVRASERLRHRERGVTPWDFERLVLQQFPEVFKAKAFPVLNEGERGRLLLVVVPRCCHDSSSTYQRPRLNADQLNRIQRYLASRTSPFATVEVRNPEYELIQVRCAARLAPWARSRQGHYLKLLDRAVSDFLSPWRQVGYRARFGWCVRRSEIETHILEQDFVEFVTRFSMFHISEEEGRYTLEDTVPRSSGEGNVEVEEICPAHPWSIAVPMSSHYITLLREMQAIAAEPAGIDELEVGSTFIIGV